MGELVPFRYYVKDLRVEFKVPDSDYLRSLSLSHLKGIYNAWSRAIRVDTYGRLWVLSDELHNILRTSQANARYFLLNVEDEFKIESESKVYVQCSEVCRFLDSGIQGEAGSIKREKYLRFSEAIYRDMRDSDKLSLIRAEMYELMNTERKKLKQRRKGDLKVQKDELTGDELVKGYEFSHIRSVSSYLHLADRYWNGLLVNKETHAIITQEGIQDEVQLYKLCLYRGWSLEWYEPFLKSLKSLE